MKTTIVSILIFLGRLFITSVLLPTIMIVGALGGNTNKLFETLRELWGVKD